MFLKSEDLVKRTVLMLTAVALVAACGAKTETPVIRSEAPTAAPVATAQAAPAASIAPESSTKLAGKVLESFDAAGYTYLRVATTAGEEWAAVAQTKVAEGSNVTIDAQMTLENFESKSLNRKFDRIVFGTIAAPNAALPRGGMMSSAAMPAGHPPVDGAQPAANPMGSPAQHMAGPANAGDVKVEKAAGPNAKTVAEIWRGKAALADKPVVVRGKVVKFLGGIMGKNWLHLRDGSGSAENGDHDITVTTDDKVAVGTIVTVTGVVRVDKDFGAGYRYEAIIEEAKVK